MNYAYVCPKCKSVYSRDTELPDETRVCPDCKDRLCYLKHTKDGWDQKSSEDKAAFKETIIEERIQHAADPDRLTLEKFTKMEYHLSVIKGILVFFTMLAVFGMFIRSVH